MRYSQKFSYKCILFVAFVLLVVYWHYYFFEHTLIPPIKIDVSRFNLGLPFSEWKQNFTTDYFKCEKSQKRILLTQVNDDYCDCPDGSDERGTNACPTNNYGFFCYSAFIHSSFINDGICDCCDGSDEYKTGIKCPYKCTGEPKETTRPPLEYKNQIEEMNNFGMYMLYFIVFNHITQWLF